MSKEAEISRQVLAKVAEGMNPVDALKAVCGADKVDEMISNLFHQLRGEA